MIREFLVKMAVAVREFVSDPGIRRPVIVIISLIWLQVIVLIGTVLQEEEVRSPAPIFTGPVPASDARLVATRNRITIRGMEEPQYHEIECLCQAVVRIIRRVRKRTAGELRRLGKIFSNG